MPRTSRRKPHPADIANAQIIAAAVRFEIALFLGTGNTRASAPPRWPRRASRPPVSSRSIPTAARR
jgi:hypothetical protein